MKCIFSFFLLLFSTFLFSTEKPLEYIENKGQWESNILFKSFVPSGELYLENDRLSYVFYDQQKQRELHHQQCTHNEAMHACNDQKIDAHAFSVHFINGQMAVTKGQHKQVHYHNYFIGNNPEKWKGKVGLYTAVNYHELYAGIDLKLYSQGSHFKYDFIVQEKANTDQIQLQYEGVEPALLANGSILIDLGFNQLVEKKPYAYQLIDGQKKEVPCQYVLEEKVLSFAFPEGYDKNQALVIDPVLIASTLSNSTVTNYGHSATFDASGNIYTGARNFGAGYPTTLGAFQLNFGGGGTDIAISKLNPDGSSLLWASYLGGSDAEYPHSMFVSNAEELFVYGSCYSTNYPTTANAYQSNLNGTVDIIVTHLSQDGSSLIGSTYIGGSDVDGINNASSNYGDSYRGEIIVDTQGKPLISSFSSSLDFPTSSTAYQSNNAGGQDGVAFKMNQDLSVLEWGTFLGSSGDDAAFGIRTNDLGEVYVTGTAGDGFPTTTNAAIPNFIGGNNDGFVAKLNTDGSTLLSSSFFGSTGDDQSFFIDLDLFGNVYIYGQNDSIINRTPTCYGTDSSAQFIAKFSPGLGSIDWQTCFGTGSLNNSSGWVSHDLVPDAFMVDVCRNIYISGYYADANLNVTTGALFTSGGFYQMVLDPNASNLQYATFYSGDHVDGGTSRFDPNGVIYQAVCSGGGFSTTANAYAPNQTPGWDIGVFKIDFEAIGVNAVANPSPSTSGCVPLTVDFSNFSSASSFIWDFDDGSPTTTVAAPSHTFTSVGAYDVSLVAIDSNSCNIADTFFIQINVSDTVTNFDFSYNNACEDSLIQFQSIGGSNNDVYSWDFDDGASSTEMNPTHSYSSADNYTVRLIASGVCSSQDTIEKILSIAPPPLVNLGADTLLCWGDTLTLDAGNPTSSHQWSTGANQQSIVVNTAGIYTVTVGTTYCETVDSIQVELDTYDLDIGPDTSFCHEPFSLYLDAGTNAQSYLWSNGATSSSIEVSSAGIYQVTITNANDCQYSDAIEVRLNEQPLPVFESNIQEACAPAVINFSDLTLLASDEVSAWDWYFEGQANRQEEHPITHWEEAGTYDVGLHITTLKGCSDSILLSDFITIHPSPHAEFISNPEKIDWCNPTLQFINQSSNYDQALWKFGDENYSTEVSPWHTFTEVESQHIHLYVENEEGCQDSVSYTIGVSSEIPLYAPNAFTPEKDGINETFRPKAECLKDFEMWIYDQWGGLVFYSNDLTKGWDGTYKNKACQIGVYGWKIKYHGGSANQILTGNVTLLR